MGVDGDGDRSTFGRVFGAALAARGASLSWLQRRLIDTANPVSIATLSYWRSGERSPEGPTSLAAVEEIERLLGLEADSLVGLVPERVRLGTVHDPKMPFTEAQITEAVEETYKILDAPPMDIARELTTQVVADIDADGRLRQRTTRSLIQSVVPNTVDAVTYSIVSPDGEIGRPNMKVSGARLIRDHLHANARVYMCVLELSETLTLGGTTMLEIALSAGDDERWRPESGAFVVRRIRDLVLWTRFHPDAVPDWIEEFERSDATGETAYRSLRPQASVHQTRRDFGPGALGLRWGYEER